MSSTKRNNKNIFFEKDTLYLGDVNIGDSAVGVLKLKNLNDSSIKIVNVGTSCECTSSMILEKDIMSNSFGEIKIKYNNNGDSGIIYKTIIVETNANPKFNPAYLCINAVAQK